MSLPMLPMLPKRQNVSMSVGLAEARSHAKASEPEIHTFEIRHFTPHGLRRTFSLLGEGAKLPARAIEQAMGHAVARMDEHYQPRRIGILRVEMTQLEEFVIEQAKLPAFEEVVATQTKKGFRARPFHPRWARLNRPWYALTEERLVLPTKRGAGSGSLAFVGYAVLDPKLPRWCDRRSYQLLGTLPSNRL